MGNGNPTVRCYTVTIVQNCMGSKLNNQFIIFSRELYWSKHTRVSGGNEGSLQSFHLIRHLVGCEHLYPRVSEPIMAFRSRQV